MQDSACRRTVKVNLESGMHLRPYSMIAEAASRFVAEIQLLNGERTADAKAVLELMSLNADFGAELILEANGGDAGEAVDALAQLFDTNFDEEVAPSES